MQEAYERSVEALGLAIVSRKKEIGSLPSPSTVEEIKAEDGILVVIEFDMLNYHCLFS